MHKLSEGKSDVSSASEGKISDSNLTGSHIDLSDSNLAGSLVDLSYSPICDGNACLCT